MDDKSAGGEVSVADDRVEPTMRRQTEQPVPASSSGAVVVPSQLFPQCEHLNITATLTFIMAADVNDCEKTRGDADPASGNIFGTILFRKPRLDVNS